MKPLSGCGSVVARSWGGGGVTLNKTQTQTFHSQQ